MLRWLGGIVLVLALVAAGLWFGRGDFCINTLDFDVCILDEASKALATESLVPYLCSKHIGSTGLPVSVGEIPENQRYHKYTPSGSIEISITNPPASDVFLPGKSFYVDFTAVE